MTADETAMKVNDYGSVILTITPDKDTEEAFDIFFRRSVIECSNSGDCITGTGEWIKYQESVAKDKNEAFVSTDLTVRLTPTEKKVYYVFKAKPGDIESNTVSVTVTR